MKLRSPALRVLCALLIALLGLGWSLMFSYGIFHSKVTLYLTGLLNPGFFVIFMELNAPNWQIWVLMVLLSACYWYLLLSLVVRLRASAQADG